MLARDNKMKLSASTSSYLSEASSSSSSGYGSRLSYGRRQTPSMKAMTEANNPIAASSSDEDANNVNLGALRLSRRIPSSLSTTAQKNDNEEENDNDKEEDEQLKTKVSADNLPSEMDVVELLKLAFLLQVRMK